MSAPASGRPPPGEIRRVVVAYDGSDPSVRAAQFALGLAARVGAGVWLVHASTRAHLAAEPRTEEEQGSESAAVEHGLRALRAAATPATLPVETWVREGTAPEVVLGAAAEVGADLIVVGTRGLRGAGRVVLGSVSAALVVRSKCPVVVVP